jgi:hypothetical protein
MTMIDPTILEKYKIWLIGGGLLLVLVIVALWMSDCGSNWKANREINADKNAIANKTNQIANDTAAIEQAKQDRAQHVGELQVLANTLVAANLTDERAKQEVQQAAANLASVVNSNSNAVAARAEDVNRKLDQLGIQ